MKFLHLDPDFSQRPPAIAHQSFVFSGGEPHIKLEGDAAGPVTITTRLNSFEAVGQLLLATDALKRAGATDVHLIIPYFPAARQDRVMVPGEPLSVKVYADLINAQGYASVAVFDPHSDVTGALLDRVRVVTNHRFVAEVASSLSDYLLVSPDGGALKKVYKLSDALGGVEVVECSKKRNVTTGKLDHFQVYDEDLRGKPCLLVDDICDGGGTFIGLAGALKARNAGPIHLAVSHGIFAKGIEPVAEHFESISVTDSVRKLEHPKLRQWSAAELVMRNE